jgi:hypothetical protein
VFTSIRVAALYSLLVCGYGLTGGAMAPLSAQEHPPFLPTRDFTISYQIGQSTQRATQGLLVSFSARGYRFHIEATGQPGWIIFDPELRRAFAVVPQSRAFIELPFDPSSAQQFMLNDQMNFARRGTDRVAGFACTVWDVRSERGTGRICMTEDGVMLRGSNSQGFMEVAALQYGAQPDELFQPPPGFRKLDSARLNLWGGLLR